MLSCLGPLPPAPQIVPHPDDLADYAVAVPGVEPLLGVVAANHTKHMVPHAGEGEQGPDVLMAAGCMETPSQWLFGCRFGVAENSAFLGLTEATTGLVPVGP